MSRTIRPCYVLMVPWVPAGPGGVNQVVVNLFDTMQRQDAVVPVMLVNDWNAAGAPAVVRVSGRPAVRMRLVQPKFGRGSLHSWISFFVRLPPLLARIALFIRNRRVVAINAHYPDLSLLPLILGRKIGLLRARVVISLHGLDLRHAATLRGIERRLWSWMLAGADRVVACADGLRQEAAASFPECSARVATIYNGVDVELVRSRLRSSESPIEIGATERLLVNIGTFEHKKGQDVLLSAFARLTKRHPGLRLVIAGRSAPTGVFEQLERQALTLSIEARVTLLKDLEHGAALKLMKNAEIFVLPSRNEGFAVVLLEAGALSVPVVATRICGVEELISNGEDGIVVLPDDPQALADAIEKMLVDRAAAWRMAENLHRKVVEEFTWRRATEAYLELSQA